MVTINSDLHAEFYEDEGGSFSYQPLVGMQSPMIAQQWSEGPHEMDQLTVEERGDPTTNARAQAGAI